MALHFMSRQEIADYIGVDLSTIKRSRSIPPPDVIVGRNQGWARETIDAWLAGRGRRPRGNRKQEKHP